VAPFSGHSVYIALGTGDRESDVESLPSGVGHDSMLSCLRKYLPFHLSV